MADGTTYGLTFPFRDSFDGKYLDLSDYNDQEIRSNLIHLLLSKKGSRYYLPDFGTRLYEFLFEPLDIVSFDVIEADIRDSVAKYIPNLTIINIVIEPLDVSEEVNTSKLNIDDFGLKPSDKIYRSPGNGTYQNTAKIKIEFTSNTNAFAGSDFVVINI
jgi:phage baseplate assembly protein W